MATTTMKKSFRLECGCIGRVIDAFGPRLFHVDVPHEPNDFVETTFELDDEVLLQEVDNHVSTLLASLRSGDEIKKAEISLAFEHSRKAREAMLDQWVQDLLK